MVFGGALSNADSSFDTQAGRVIQRSVPINVSPGVYDGVFDILEGPAFSN
jgi:hypothetical protein